MRRLNLILVCSICICACSTTRVTYNPKEFDTSNYQKNVELAVDAADVLNDFDENKIPKANLEASDFSSLVQADIYFNQGNYVAAYPFYNKLSSKYQDPRIIYKAITCLEHISTTPDQLKELDRLVNLFIKVTPDSQLSKLFQIKVALSMNNIDLAENNLDALMKNNPANGRSVLLFVSSLITGDLISVNQATLTKFGDYVISKYGAYPESNLLAMVSYAIANNSNKLIESLKVTHAKFPNWEIPAIWSAGILEQTHKESSVIVVLGEYFKIDKTPDPLLQNIYIGSLITTNQLDIAKTYLNNSFKDGGDTNNTLINAGIINARLGDYNHALNNFLRVNGNNKELYGVVQLIVASIYDYKGNTQDAIKYYRRVSNTNPYLGAAADLMLLNNYATIGDDAEVGKILEKLASSDHLTEKQKILFKTTYYAELERYTAAYDLLSSHYKSYRNDKDFLYQYAGMAAMTKKPAQAILMYKRYIKLAPQDAYGYNNLAFIYIDQTKDYKRGYSYAQKALMLNPDDYSILDTVGWAYYKKGDYKLALKYVNLSLGKMYEVDTARHLQAIYLALGEHEKASEVIIANSDKLQKDLKLQLLNKSLELISFIQFGIVFK